MNVFVFNNDTEQGGAYRTEGVNSSCKRQGQTLPHVRSSEGKDEKDAERCRTLHCFEEDGKMSHSTWYSRKTILHFTKAIHSMLKTVGCLVLIAYCVGNTRLRAVGEL